MTERPESCWNIDVRGVKHHAHNLLIDPLLRRTESPMRTSRIATVLVVVGLVAALSGCGTSPSTTLSYTLIQEPQDGRAGREKLDKRLSGKLLLKRG